MDDPFDLQRFLDAQAQVIDEVLSELRNGQKVQHWMWFIFPQLSGLGSSWMSQRYAIKSRAEAEAYLAHPILGPRLLECTRIVNALEGKTIEEILSSVDAMKFRSSMSLFAAVVGHQPEFSEALNKYFSGEPDPFTLRRL